MDTTADTATGTSISTANFAYKNSFLDKSSFRSGKWTPEEEAYSNSLIRAFTNGSLPDAKQGVSLRHYLSVKLRCNPKRVSKKFEGKQNTCWGWSFVYRLVAVLVFLKFFCRGT